MKALTFLPAAALALTLAAGCAGTASTDTGSADITAETKSDAAIKAAIESAAKDVIYISESDYPWSYVTAKGDPAGNGPLSVEQVRTLFASYVDGDPDTDKPMAKLASETRTWEEWTEGELGEPCEGNEDCLRSQKLYETLGAELTDRQVFIFGQDGSDGYVNGVAVSIFVVGRTPQGNWAGVRTIAIWT